MAFGQQSGPPATGRQIQQLTELLHAAGHTDFRDARGPLGLTQRQAGGRFTRDEAEALITRLEDEAHAGPPAGVPEPSVPSVRSGRRRPAGGAVAAAEMPSELLAAELQRRGWVVMEP
jgi:hypothetical protein